MELVGRGMLSQEGLPVCLVDGAVSLTFQRQGGSRQCVSLLSELREFRRGQVRGCLSRALSYGGK